MSLARYVTNAMLALYLRASTTEAADTVVQDYISSIH